MIDSKDQIYSFDLCYLQWGPCLGEESFCGIYIEQWSHAEMFG